MRALVLEARDSPEGVTIYRTWIDGTLDLDFLTMAGPLTLVGCHLPEELTLRHAQIGTINFSGTNIWGLRAEGLRTRELDLGGGRFSDILELDHAQVDGTCCLAGASVGTLSAYGLKVGGSLMATDLYAWPGYRGGCAVFLDRAEIGGDLVFDGGTISGLDGPAITANGARVGGVVSAENAVVRGNADAFFLLDADIGGLDLRDTVLRGSLCTDGSRIRSEVKMGGINAVTQEGAATIRMVDTKIGAGLLLTGLVRNRAGQAVSLHMATVGASLTVRDAEIDADSAEAALEISNCDVGSELTIRPASLRNRGDGLELDLFTTRAGRAFALEPEHLTEADVFTVSLNGLSYPDTPNDTDAWLTMLRDHTFSYEAQPYQQLAAVHRSAGHEHTARRVLIAQQRDLRRRGDPGTRLWHWFLGVTLGYGYRPSRAVIGLLVTFLLALCLVWTTNAYNGLTPAKDRPADSCSPVNRISLAADLAIPLVKLGGTPRCELANGPAGQWATGAGWIVQILGWSFATLSVAGFTGLVRKS
ncbi:hypothetical protein JNUCC0626_30875 [Lentzea sp. JNUCC 0626]|uniref:hypothetical protein n=1 Tax=Lentzea sp. JNUCC 0626 TaxID=3367513 RepID=UPI003748424D